MIGELVARLIAAGTPPELAAVVVADAFQAGVELKVRMEAEMMIPDPPRSSAAIRQQRYRERNATVTKRNESVTERNGVTPVTDRNESVTNHNETVTRDVTRDAALYNKKESKKEERKLDRRASQISADWRPDPEPWKVSVGKLGAARCETELIRFKNHAADKGRLSKNWNAAWRNWCDRALDYGAKLNGQAADNPKAGSLIGAIDRRLAEIEGEPDSALPEDNLFRLPNRPI